MAHRHEIEGGCRRRMEIFGAYLGLNVWLNPESKDCLLSQTSGKIAQQEMASEGRSHQEWR
jgi:hypothetical protein